MVYDAYLIERPQISSGVSVYGEFCILSAWSFAFLMKSADSILQSNAN